jgi:transcriptional regulator with XRE-family HTH domain
MLGPLIKTRLESIGMSKAELARRLGMSPANVHKIFKRPSVDIALLKEIGDVLNYDFILHYRHLARKPASGNMILPPLIGFDPMSGYSGDIFKKIWLIMRVCNNLAEGDPAWSPHQFIEGLDLMQDILNDIRSGIQPENQKIDP